MKKNIGVTLIALIITIIVLLILAGITLNLVLGDSGIISKARIAKERTDETQEEEQEKLNSYENIINDYITRSGNGTMPSTIIYPNNGTEENPATIVVNQRIVTDNPYPGHRVYCIAEIQEYGYWGEPGFIYTSRGGWGVSARQLTGNNEDKIVIQSGSYALVAGSEGCGAPFEKLENDQVAPIRVIIICLN